jgi:hypothetical protein
MPVDCCPRLTRVRALFVVLSVRFGISKHLNSVLSSKASDFIGCSLDPSRVRHL